MFEKEEVHSDGDEPIGMIVDQNPKGGMSVRIGSTVTLVVNAGGEMAEVPDVSNYLSADAEATLINNDFVPNLIEIADDTVEEGRVIRTDPAAHSSYAKGATVNVYVSSGPSDTTVTVPSNLIGLPLETARQVLVDAGLSVGQTSPRDDTGKEEGVIVDCYPLPGTKVDEGTAVDLTYSSGKESEKQLDVTVDLPTDVTYDLPLKAYMTAR